MEFSFRDGAILEVETVKASREAVQFSTRVEDGRCAFMFDFLDHDDGVVLDVLHTAGEITPTFSGTLKGMPSGIRNYGLLIPEIRTMWGGLALGLTAASTGVMVLIVANSLGLSGWGLIIFAAAIGVGALSFVAIAVMRQQERTLPASLRLPPQS